MRPADTPPRTNLKVRTWHLVGRLREQRGQQLARCGAVQRHCRVRRVQLQRQQLQHTGSLLQRRRPRRVLRRAATQLRQYLGAIDRTENAFRSDCWQLQHAAALLQRLQPRCVLHKAVKNIHS